MKMTNKEMIEKHNSLDAFQVKEKEHYAHTGEHLLKGRINIIYAIEKNKEEFRQKLKPYDKMLAALFEEYRDTEAEQAALKAEAEAAQRENRDEKDVEIIMREGKTKEDYFKKIEELKDVEIEDLNIHYVDIAEFTDLNIDSADLRPFMFMIAD